jgi:sterol desaturase/sphingolipid hydroxylase (fatty acid hydroxylase superfamily)
MQSVADLNHQILGLVVHVARLFFWLALMVAVFVPLERFFSVRRAKLFYRGWATNLGWYFINGLTPVFLLGPPSALIAMVIHAILPATITGAAAMLPLWVRMVAAMVVGEIGFYWGHRWSHQIPLLWRFHAIHHSAEHVSFLVNTRAHPVDMVFTRLCGLVLLYAFGLASPVGPHPTLVPALVLFVGSMWSFFIHANLRWRLGPFEELISSPAFHHWHHTKDDHKDHNYSSMLPFMDRMFGTFYLPKREWPAEYGIAAAMPSGVGEQLLHPLIGGRPSGGAARNNGAEQPSIGAGSAKSAFPADL